MHIYSPGQFPNEGTGLVKSSRRRSCRHESAGLPESDMEKGREGKFALLDFLSKMRQLDLKLIFCSFILICQDQ